MRLFIITILAVISKGEATAQSPNSRVLIIGIDGVRSDALISAETPNIDNLIAGGFYSPNCLNDDITISGTGWSNILCGVRSDKHLVEGNETELAGCLSAI